MTILRQAEATELGGCHEHPDRWPRRDIPERGRTTDVPRALLHTAWLAALFLTVRGVGILQRPGLDRVGPWLVRIALVGVGAQTVAAAVERWA